MKNLSENVGINVFWFKSDPAIAMYLQALGTLVITAVAGAFHKVLQDSMED